MNNDLFQKWLHAAVGVGLGAVILVALFVNPSAQESLKRADQVGERADRLQDRCVVLESRLSHLAERLRWVEGGGRAVHVVDGPTLKGWLDADLQGVWRIKPQHLPVTPKEE